MHRAVCKALRLSKMDESTPFFHDYISVATFHQNNFLNRGLSDGLLLEDRSGFLTLMKLLFLVLQLFVIIKTPITSVNHIQNIS
uniref:Putative ovule protein n=1 Tax=Solanum chacoense TaxID=4108 RepID=A0A0V0H2N2_SOLCH